MARVGAYRKTRAELLAAIHADPSDLAARAVYADLLQEAGEARGEFIALQLAGNATQREKTLLKEYRDRWLGPLASLLGRSSSRFANGFLHSAALAKPVRWMPELLDHPELRTVEVLDVVALGASPDAAPQTAELLLHLPKLQELAIDGRVIAATALCTKHHPLRRLSVKLPSVVSLLGVLQLHTFSGLRSLRVSGMDPGPEALVRLASVVPLESFECDLAGGIERDAIAIGKLANIVATLVVTGGWGRLRVTRDGDKLLVTTQNGRRDPRFLDRALSALVGALGRDRVTVKRG